MTDASLATPPAPYRPRGPSVFAVALVPVALVAAVSFWISGLLVFGIMANPALNLSIIGIAVIAALYALVRARETDRERRQIAGLGRDLAAPGDRPGAAGAASGPVGRAVAKLAASARTEGQRGFARALDREIDGLRSTLAQRLSILQYVTGLLISLGLLGTFLGLLRTLVASSEVLQAVGLGVDPTAVADPTEAFATMILSLQAPLTNMGTAFSSSLFGLVGSITIGVMALIVQRAGIANIGAFRDIVSTRQADLFSFRASAPPDGEVVEDILAAMLDRERLALQRSDAILGEVGRMAEAVSALAGPIAASATRIGDSVAALDVLPQWCLRNDGLAQGLAEAALRIERVEQALSRQTEVLDAMAGRLGEDGSRAAEQLASLGREQAAQRAAGDAALAVLRGLAAEAGELRAAFGHGAAETLQALTALAGDQRRAWAALEVAVETAGQQVAEPLGRLRDDVAALAAEARTVRREAEDRHAGALRQGLDTLAGLQDGNAALLRTAEAAGTTLADLGTRVAEAERALATLAAASPGVAGTLHAVALAAEALPGIDRTARRLETAVARIGGQLDATEAAPGSLGAALRGIAAAAAGQQAAVATLADRAGRLETAGSRIEDRLGVTADTLARIADRVAAAPAGAEVLEELARIGRTLAALSGAVADQAQAARDSGGATGTALARLLEIAADLRSQGGDLLAGAGATRDGIAAATDRLRDLAAGLSSLRDLLAAPPAPAGVMQELARAREVLGQLATVLGDSTRLGLRGQDQIGTALRSLADLLGADRAGRGDRTPEDIARLAASLDLLARNDRDRAELVEKLTALVAAMRLQQQRASETDAGQRRDLDAVRTAFAGFEARIAGLLQRIERALGRNESD